MKAPQSDTAQGHEAAVPAPESSPEKRWLRLPGQESGPRATPGQRARRHVKDRVEVQFGVALTAIDPQRDPVTGEIFYETGDAVCVINASPRGICVRFAHPFAAGTRLLLALGLGEDPRPVEVTARVCWSRVQYESGTHGGRPVAAVGVELQGGSRDAFERYERSLERLVEASVAGREATG